MVKNELTINVTALDLDKYFKSINFLKIPTDCYTDTIENPNRSIHYEVFYKGEKINDVFGIIRYSNDCNHKQEKITNWQEEFGE